jgi:hypothetical protein
MSGYILRITYLLRKARERRDLIAVINLEQRLRYAS